ncbi:MAG: proteasome assembly chaperone family protein [Thermoplasmata archaeon]|nr:PAC2 family protein [Thermoplasmata archaeon]
MVEFTWRDEGTPADGIAPKGVIVSAFPSAGLATIVAGHYMIRSLKLPRVGRFESPDLSPIAVVQGGEVNPTIRVYGRRDLALVLSEFPPTPSQANAIARTVLDVAEKRAARLILCLEGVVPHPADDDEEVANAPEPDTPAPEQVWVAFSRRDPELVKTFLDTGARPLEDGVIGGVSGALLIQALGRKVPVATLLVSAQAAEGLPDHRAGAALIETLDKLLPELKIDTGPLRKQAEQIERMLRAAMKTRPPPAEPSTEGPRDPSMYR